MEVPSYCVTVEPELSSELADTHASFPTLNQFIDFSGAHLSSSSADCRCVRGALGEASWPGSPQFQKTPHRLGTVCKGLDGAHNGFKMPLGQDLFDDRSHDSLPKLANLLVRAGRWFYLRTVVDCPPAALTPSMIRTLYPAIGPQPIDQARFRQQVLGPERAVAFREFPNRILGHDTCPTNLDIQPAPSFIDVEHDITAPERQTLDEHQRPPGQRVER